jgi:catechol 2,3-dioxygenase-like lactoylglutathione lyase family enzyme
MRNLFGRPVLALVPCWLALAGIACDQAGSDPYRQSEEAVLEQTLPALDAGTTTTPASLLGAFGIVVTDLKKSTDFYTRVLGMKQTASYNLANMDEVVLAHDNQRGSSLVLMQYKDGTKFTFPDPPMLKLVSYVADAKAVVEKIRAEGYKVTREAAPAAVLNNTVLGFAKDPDGYDLEIIQFAR